MSENSNWTRVKIGDIVDSISENNTVAEKPVVLINTSDVLEGKVLNHLEIKNENLKGQFKKSFKENDTLLSEIRPINNRNAFVNFNPDNYIASTKLMVLRPKYNNLKHKYLYYLLTSKNSLEFLQALAESRSGTFPQITFSTLSEIEISLPPIEEQNSIVNILSSFDDKIENNNSIIANLEEQAQTIFKSWFVDFEPFQDGDFIKSELGELPEKWGMAKLSNLFEIKYGKNLPTKKLEEEGFPVFGGNGQIGYYHEYLFKEPKLLISCRGAASGKVLVSLPNSFITNNSLVMNEFNRDYFHYFKYLFNTIEFENYATGSAQPQITISNIKDIEVVVPTEDIIKKFNKLLNPFFTLQLNLKKENIRLEETRDILLPKLMSGEIRVEDTIEVEEI